MSFPRAKIQRFNDVLRDVPSPTKYDPKTGEKIKGGLFPKGDREGKSQALSDTASNSTSKSLIAPVFRTPQLPRKHNCMSTEKSHSAVKSICFKSEDHDFLLHDADNEELNSLKTECANKTETILELEKHLHDLKVQVSESENLRQELEKHVRVLETANANLDCIRANNDNYEEQIKCLTAELKNLTSGKEEAELKYTKLEEENLDCERKIISLEGTIEQLEMEFKNKETVLEETTQECEKLKVSMECFSGKIETLEKELRDMEGVRSKNEATIFGLETQVSTLNGSVEALRGEKEERTAKNEELCFLIKELESVCKLHEDTITGLDMQVGEKAKQLKKVEESNSQLAEKVREVQKEVESLKEDKTALTTAWEAKESTLLAQIKDYETEVTKLVTWIAEKEEELQQLVSNHEMKLKEVWEELQANIGAVQQEKKALTDRMLVMEEDRNNLVSSHAEEILKLQNEYEMKVLSHLQDSSEKQGALQQQIAEREAAMIHLSQRHMQVMETAQSLEAQLHDREDYYQTLIIKKNSEHLEQVEMIKEAHDRKITEVETASKQAVSMKEKELIAQVEQYKEVLEELKALILDIEKKDKEIASVKTDLTSKVQDLEKATVTNDNLNARLKNMLEEIKLLNKEATDRERDLKTMKQKYESEAGKNEKLSEQLGELDSEIRQVKTELKQKAAEKEKADAELRKSKERSEVLQARKVDLEVVVVELQDRVDSLTTELGNRKTSFDAEMKRILTNLNDVKRQCRKFEIAMADTRKSLEALGDRLIESETEVEKLNADNADMKNQLAAAEKEVEELEDTNTSLQETNKELETNLSKLQGDKDELLKRCAEFEAKESDLQASLEDLRTLTVCLKKDKEDYEENLKVLKEMVFKQEGLLTDMEKNAKQQIDSVSGMLLEKLEAFQQFSTQKIQSLASDLIRIRATKVELEEKLKAKHIDFENLTTDHEILKTTIEITLKENEEIRKNHEESRAEAALLKEQVHGLGKEKDAAVASLRDKQEECTALQELCNDNYAKVEVLEGIKQEKETLHQQCQDLETTVADLKKEFTNLQDRNTKLQDTCDRLSKDLSSLEVSREKAVAEQTTAEATLKQTKEELEAMIESEMDWKAKYEDLLEDLKNVEERKDYYKANCQRLDSLLAEQYREKKDVKEEFDDKDAQLEELRKRVRDLESLVGPFREQLENYESERMLIENDRDHLRRQHLEQARQLGHQNNKQKIQHLVKLKQDLLASRQENEKLHMELKNAKKTVEKLREETGQHPKRLFINGQRPSSTPFKGKENSTQMLNIKNEPTSPSPLKNRNH